MKIEKRVWVTRSEGQNGEVKVSVELPFSTNEEAYAGMVENLAYFLAGLQCLGEWNAAQGISVLRRHIQKAAAEMENGLSGGGTSQDPFYRIH